VQHEQGEKCARTRAKRPKRAAVRTSYSPPYTSAVLHFHFGKIRVTDFARKGPFFRILLGFFLRDLIRRLCNKDVLEGILRGPAGRRCLTELLTSHGMSVEQAESALPLIEPHLSEIVEAGMPNLPKCADAFWRIAEARIPETIRNAQITALSVDPTLPGRAKLYRDFNWHIFITEKPLILGDTVCVFEGRRGERRFKVLDEPGDTCRVYMPICSDRVLVGTPYQAKPKIDISRLNKAIARCSYEYFVSSTELGMESSLPASIGKWSGFFTEDDCEPSVKESASIERWLTGIQ
jgi:hypothetical protein